MKKLLSLVNKKFWFWIIGLLGGWGILISLLFFIVLIMIIGAVTGGSSSQDGEFGAYCSSTGSVNVEQMNGGLGNAGVFTNKGDLFINVAESWGIDPVLMAAIALHETGRGTSNAVVNKNNPGGLMNPATGSKELYVFDTLADGLDAMGRTLHNRIIKDGLNTIEKLGNVYAPIGATNDPNGWNQHWIPTVSGLVQDFGGLTMNCEIGSGELVMDVPSGTFVIPTTGRKTSPFGNRFHPNDKVWRLHAGVDWADRKGSLIWSSSDGTVSKVHSGCVEGNRSCGGGWGNHVFVKHEINGQIIETVYAHLSAVQVAQGQKIKGGQVLGLMGHTGNSTGSHLHFELHIGGYKNPVDPLKYIQSK